MKPAAFLAGLALALLARSARGEPVGPLVHDRDGRAEGDVKTYAAFGLDGAIGTTLGAATGVGAAGSRHDLALFADATWMAGALDFDDYRLRLGARADVARRGVYRLQVALLPAYEETSNASFTARALSAELRVSPGIDAGRWSIEVQGAVDQTLVTYFSMTDAYRAEVYGGARDGWYAATSRIWRAGVRGAARFKSVEVSIAAGWERTGELDFLPPLYAQLAVAYALPVR